MTQTSKTSARTTTAQVDADLAALYREAMNIRSALRIVVGTLHDIAGHKARYDRQHNRTWTKTETETVNAVRAIVGAPDFNGGSDDQKVTALARYDELAAALVANMTLRLV